MNVSIVLAKTGASVAFLIPGYVPTSDDVIRITKSDDLSGLSAADLSRVHAAVTGGKPVKFENKRVGTTRTFDALATGWDKAKADGTLVGDAPVAASKPAKAAKEPKPAKAAKGPWTPRPGSSAEIVLELMTRKGGTTHEEATTAIGWKSCHGFLRETAEKAGLTFVMDDSQKPTIFRAVRG